VQQLLWEGPYGAYVLGKTFAGGALLLGGTGIYIGKGNPDVESTSGGEGRA